MRRFLEPVPEVVAAAEAAMRAEGIEPVRVPIRGGTDGSLLSEMGLPTPNIFTGGHEYHSVREWASVQDMAAAAAVVVRLAGVWAEARSLRSMSTARWPASTARSLPAAEALIPATDEGLIRGDGVFEVIRVYDGRPFALEEHLARLERSAANLRLPLDLEAVRADAHRLLARVAAARARPRGAADHGHPRRPAAAAHRAAARARRARSGSASVTYSPDAASSTG